jgi:translation initiation factor IF-1
MTGEVVEALRSGMYRVAIDGGRHEVLTYMAGKMRRYRIRIVVGDEVLRVELSGYDLTRGRIVYRARNA